MKAAIVSIALMSASLSGCTTHYRPAPTDEVGKGASGQIRLVNDQIDGDPRMLFSDGITTVTTNYKGWTDIVIARFEHQIADTTIASHSPKTLKFSIASINCTGHYVSDCAISLQVDRGNGGRGIYTAGPRSGYPLQSALDKAIAQAVHQILEDKNVIGYLEM